MYDTMDRSAVRALKKERADLFGNSQEIGM